MTKKEGREGDTMAEPTTERCARCGEDGHDRRTLWMACFYAMNELPVPFELTQITGTAQEFTGWKDLDFGGRIHKSPQFADPNPDSKVYPWRFFTLSVCKRCRADWMAAIGQWFKTTPPVEGDGLEAGAIYVRELGATVQVSQDEWNRRQVQP